MSQRPLALRYLAVLLAFLLVPLVGCDEQPRPAAPGASEIAAPHTHEVPGETCFICDASKRDPGRLWCKEHARYEDRCWDCHPELREAGRPYCDEHHLYEDECFLCDPSRRKAGADADVGAAAREDEAAKPKTAALFCNEHQVPEHECGICQPQRAGELEVGESLLVRMPSEKSADLAGLVIQPPKRVQASTAIDVLGEVRFNGNKLAQATPLAGGVISKVHADVGKTVDAGDVLAVIKSPAVARAKADYLKARTELELRRAAVERERQLFAEQIGSRSAMEAAEAAFSRAQVSHKLAGQQLRNFGFSKSGLARIQDATSHLSVRAPFRGAVVKRTAVVGEAVDTTAALFTIADLSEMWVELSVPEQHAPNMRVGTPLEVKVRGRKEAARGALVWVSPVVDEQTRMVGARGSLANPDGQLRHGTFAEVRAVVGDHPDSVRLPASAVHRIDDSDFVFVRREADLFAATRVELGDRVGDAVSVLGGLSNNDAIVMDGGFVVKSALLASRLGAGCTDD